MAIATRRHSPDPPRLRILFFLLATNFDRSFACFLEALLERGHEVEVAIEKRKSAGGLPVGAGAALADLARRFPRFSSAQLTVPPDRLLGLRTWARLTIDYLRYLEPAFRDAEALRSRARERAPWLVRRLEPLLVARPRLRRPLITLFRRLEAGLPISHGRRDRIRAGAPDVVLVSPLVGLGSAQSDWVRLAAELGVPSVLPVASWDNLTNKGVLKSIPEQVIVWNDAQAREAIELHGVPASQIVVTGAHTFDHWFTWAPSSDPAGFARTVGLPPGPFVLFACSSRFIAEDETRFVRDWVDRLRAAPDPILRDLGVLVRPHPQNARHWQDFELPDDSRFAVWPRAGSSPTAAESRTAFFDSIHHSSGVVGISTSVFIEAAIVGRPTFTILTDSFRSTQEGTLHFKHLTGDGDGPLLVGRTWDEHHDQLAEALHRPGLHDARLARFLERFVRPHGRALAAAPLAAAAVENAVAAARALASRPSASDKRSQPSAIPILAPERRSRGWRRAN